MYLPVFNSSHGFAICGKLNQPLSYLSVSHQTTPHMNPHRSLLILYFMKFHSSPVFIPLLPCQLPHLGRPLNAAGSHTLLHAATFCLRCFAFQITEMLRTKPAQKTAYCFCCRNNFSKYKNILVRWENVFGFKFLASVTALLVYTSLL